MLKLEANNCAASSIVEEKVIGNIEFDKPLIEASYLRCFNRLGLINCSEAAD